MPSFNPRSISRLGAISLIVACAPLLGGAEGDCGPAFARDPAPDMSGAWNISYDDHAELLYKLAGQMVAHLRTYLADEDEVITFGLFDGDLDQLNASQADDNRYAERIAAVEPFIESTGTSGVFEVLIDQAID